MIFLDTSFLVPVEVKTDQNHERATKVIMKKEGIRNIAAFDKDFRNVKGINVIG